jgi:hypothetical protein
MLDLIVGVGNGLEYRGRLMIFRIITEEYLVTR